MMEYTSTSGKTRVCKDVLMDMKYLKITKHALSAYRDAWNVTIITVFSVTLLLSTILDNVLKNVHLLTKLLLIELVCG